MINITEEQSQTADKKYIPIYSFILMSKQDTLSLLITEKKY